MYRCWPVQYYRYMYRCWSVQFHLYVCWFVQMLICTILLAYNTCILLTCTILFTYTDVNMFNLPVQMLSCIQYCQPVQYCLYRSWLVRMLTSVEVGRVPVHMLTCTSFIGLWNIVDLFRCWPVQYCFCRCWPAQKCLYRFWPAKYCLYRCESV